MRSRDGRESWRRLLNWDKGQAPSERLASVLLASDGYSSVDPSHPLGGKDGGKDASLAKDGLRLCLAVHFPRGQQSFEGANGLRNKFLHDFSAVERDHFDGFVFFTNQELRLAERSELARLSGDSIVDIYHLERIATLLNTPKHYGTRLEFLDIAMTSEEQLALYSQRDEEYLTRFKELADGFNAATQELVFHATGGDSYLAFDLTYSVHTKSVNVQAKLEGATSGKSARYPLLGVSVEIVDDNDEVLAFYPNETIYPGSWRRFKPLKLPWHKDHHSFFVRVSARNGAYGQHFLLKRHSSTTWRTQSILFHDLANREIRRECFDLGYPKSLKEQFPSSSSWRQGLNIPDQQIYRELRRHLIQTPPKNGQHYGLRW